MKQSTMGSRIAGRRREMGLSQAQLAESVGIVPGYLSHIERDRKRPSSVVLASIGTELRIGLDYIVYGAET